MLNYIWGFMIIIGIFYAAIHGTIPSISEGVIHSAKDAISLCITMAGVMSFWVGLMRIAEVSGLVEAATKKIMPFIDFMFPHIPKGHKAKEYITVNCIANILGLGWAATPAGLKAMESLQELNPNKEVATEEMCTFLILNISSIQLISINIIAYRSQYGSVKPASIAGPALLAELISLMAGILFAKIMAVRRK